MLTVMGRLEAVPLPHKFRGVTVMVPLVAPAPKAKLLEGVAVVAVNVTPEPE